jgi:DNA-binding transcriptional LysR family regulator
MTDGPDGFSMMRFTRRTLPLLGLRDFEAAARNGSFASAAAELGVTSGAVSQQVRALEDRIGVRLFERRPQSLVPTETADTLLPAVSGALDMLERLLSRLSRPNPHDALTVAMPASFAMGWFLPHLAEFRSRYPRIEIFPRSSNSLLSPSLEGVDAAFCHGRAGWARFDCVFLFRDEVVPLCSPGYLALHPGAPRRTTVAEYTILVSETAPDLWAEWRTEYSMSEPDNNTLTFDDDGLVIQAALNGLGIALVDRHLAATYVQDGRLIKALDVPVWEPGTGWYLVFDETRRGEEGLTALLDWMLDASAS